MLWMKRAFATTILRSSSFIASKLVFYFSINIEFIYLFSFTLLEQVRKVLKLIRACSCTSHSHLCAKQTDFQVFHIFAISYLSLVARIRYEQLLHSSKHSYQAIYVFIVFSCENVCFLFFVLIFTHYHL